jgi:hypothetical protein
VVSELRLNEIEGLLEMTVRVKVADDVPPALLAVTVYVVALCVALADPVNKPLDVLKLKPTGAAGEIE